MKKHVLFVDDEPNILSGLRRMLGSMRSEWDMAFACGGEEALVTLKEKPFDVVVSDMRMPGMDGAALLKTVTQEYPQIVRILLSGHSSEEASMRSVGVAHQFLSKPCDPDELKHKINQAFALRDLLTDDSLIRTISQLKTVPSMPTLYANIMEELTYPDSSVVRIGEIVAEDPGMTTKMLQLVNSAFFGLARHITNPVQAAGLLGAETIKALVLTIDVFSQFEGNSIESLELESIQSHCTATAMIAKQVALTEKATMEIVEASFMAGFLHDVGKLILAANMPDQYQQVIRLIHDQGNSYCEAEYEILNATHAEVGAYLLGLWGLPNPIVEATAFHHTPRKSLERTFSPLTAVHVANVLTHEQIGEEHTSSDEILDIEYLEQLNMADRVPLWRDQCLVHAKMGEKV